MRNGGHITDQADFQTRRLQRSQCRFSAGPRSLDIDLYSPDTMLPCLFHCVFRRHLRRKGGAFPGPLETLHSGRGPGDDIPAQIGNGYNGVVKSGLDMSDPLGDILFFLLLIVFFLFLSMIFQHKFLVYFLLNPLI